MKWDLRSVQERVLLLTKALEKREVGSYDSCDAEQRHIAVDLALTWHWVRDANSRLRNNG